MPKFPHEKDGIGRRRSSSLSSSFVEDAVEFVKISIAFVLLALFFVASAVLAIPKIRFGSFGLAMPISKSRRSRSERDAP